MLNIYWKTGEEEGYVINGIVLRQGLSNGLTGPPTPQTDGGNEKEKTLLESSNMQQSNNRGYMLPNYASQQSHMVTNFFFFFFCSFCKNLELMLIPISSKDRQHYMLPLFTHSSIKRSQNSLHRFILHIIQFILMLN